MPLPSFFRKSPVTSPPAPSSKQKNGNNGLSNEEFERKYAERKRTLSGASTASFNEPVGINNDDNNDDSNEENKFNDGIAGHYKPKEGSTVSSLIPHHTNVRKLNHVPQINIKNKVNATYHELVTVPRIEELTKYTPTPTGLVNTGGPFSVYGKRKTNPKPSLLGDPLFRPSPTALNWRRTARRGKKKRQTRRR